jgi:hypothetical protein
MVGSLLIQNLKTRDDGSRLWRQETVAALYNDLSSSRTTPNILRINWFNLAPPPQDAAEQNRCGLASAAPSTANNRRPGFVTVLSRFCLASCKVMSNQLLLIRFCQILVSVLWCYHCCIETGSCDLSLTGLDENKFPVPGRLHPCA